MGFEHIYRGGGAPSPRLMKCVWFSDKATDPENPADRWDCIQRFYELVNREPEGPQTAVRLLAHKIQSPQEKEALQAITLLEACMNYCGKKFHNEAGKFRFLNELIKVLSPKYLGAYSAEVVKQKVAEMLYSWTQWLKDEPKIQEAYTMLKKQGIIKKDPKLPEEIFMPPPSQRVEVSVFDDEDKSKLLARLLKSTNPEDLQTANRFIKNTIKEEQEKVERESRRVNTLEEVEKNATQLRGLLERHRGSGAHAQPTDGMKTLYERCDKLRPNLFRLASETVDNDEALAQILQANDQLTSVITIYKEMSEKPGVNGRRSSDEANQPWTRPQWVLSNPTVMSYLRYFPSYTRPRLLLIVMICGLGISYRTLFRSGSNGLRMVAWSSGALGEACF
uniref:Uncharacterized protein n=1 Tax=Denticeps clupeoides TaxID=299321 RepID=A0AAY4APR5_9TELE